MSNRSIFCLQPKLQGTQAERCSATFQPVSGTLGPNAKMKVTVTLITHFVSLCFSMFACVVFSVSLTAQTCWSRNSKLRLCPRQREWALENECRRKCDGWMNVNHTDEVFACLSRRRPPTSSPSARFRGWTRLSSSASWLPKPDPSVCPTLSPVAGRNLDFNPPQAASQNHHSW